MSEPRTVSEQDEQLLIRLGDIARRLDPPPVIAYDMGHAAFDIYRIDDELAALVADSLADAAAVRATATDVRLLTFQCPGMTVDIQSSRMVGGNSVLGQLVRTGPANGGLVHLETPTGTLSSAVIDADDRFEIAHVPDRLVRLRIMAVGAPSVTTAWVRL